MHTNRRFYLILFAGLWLISVRGKTLEAADNLKARAIALTEKGHYLEAQPLFLEVVKENPQDADAWYRLAETHDWAGGDIDWPTAYKKYLKYRGKPVTGEDFYRTGLADERLQRHKEAAENYNRAIRLHKDYYGEAISGVRVPCMKLSKEDQKAIGVDCAALAAIVPPAP